MCLSAEYTTSGVAVIVPIGPPELPLTASCQLSSQSMLSLTEPTLGTAGLNDLKKTRAELLDGGNVRGEDTHVTRAAGKVDLSDLLRVVDSLFFGSYLVSKKQHERLHSHSEQTSTGKFAHVVREDEAQLELVADSLGVTTAAEGELGQGTGSHGGSARCSGATEGGEGGAGSEVEDHFADTRRYEDG